MSIINEMTAVNFSYNGERHSKDLPEAKGFASGVIASSNKTSSLFTNISASRTTLHALTRKKFRHFLVLMDLEGPFLPQDFLKMMQFTQGISNDEWVKHMKATGRVTVLEPSQEEQQAPQRISRKRKLRKPTNRALS